jgi:hypothetical protein
VSIYCGRIRRGSGGTSGGSRASTLALLCKLALLFGKEVLVVFELLVPGSEPAAGAEPRFGTTCESQLNGRVHVVLATIVRSVLLESSAVKVESFGASQSLAVPELITIISITEHTALTAFSPATAGVIAFTAFWIRFVIRVGVVLVFVEAVVITHLPVSFLGRFGSVVRQLFGAFRSAESGAGGAIIHDRSDQLVNLLRHRRDLPSGVSVTRLQVTHEDTVFVLVPVVVVGPGGAVGGATVFVDFKDLTLDQVHPRGIPSLLLLLFLALFFRVKVAGWE